MVRSRGREALDLPWTDNRSCCAYKERHSVEYKTRLHREPHILRATLTLLALPLQFEPAKLPPPLAGNFDRNLSPLTIPCIFPTLPSATHRIPLEYNLRPCCPCHDVIKSQCCKFPQLQASSQWQALPTVEIHTSHASNRSRCAARRTSRRAYNSA